MIDPYNWKKDLRRMKLDNIKMRSPGFFEVSGGYDSSLAPNYTDSTLNGLVKSLADYLTFTGYTVTKENEVSVSVQEVKRFNIYSEQLQTVGKSITRTAPEEPGVIIIARKKGATLKIKAIAGRYGRQSAEQTAGVSFTAHSFPSFLEWFNSSPANLPRQIPFK